MNRNILQFAAFVIAAGSAAGSSRETDAIATVPSANFFERLDGGKDGVSLAWGEHTTARLIETQAMLIRHTATKLQRQVAEKNAKAYVAKLAPEKKLQLAKKKVRYLAVPTVRSNETSPEAKEVLMIWDIPRETLVGKNAYELSTEPAVGKLASYDNLVAEYVGRPAKDF